jgi:hypothetical protein
MKKYYLFLFILFYTISSCSRYVIQTVTTHQEVMNSYKTKEQIIKKFGLPTIKKNEGKFEEWYYEFSAKTITDGAAVSRTNTNRNGSVVGGSTYFGNPALVSGNNSRTNNTAQSRVITQEVKTYVKFTLEGDKVILWDSKGVDYGVYEKVKK